MVGETTASALAVQARQEMGVMDEALLAERAQAVIGKTAVVARKARAAAEMARAVAPVTAEARASIKAREVTFAAHRARIAAGATVVEVPSPSTLLKQSLSLTKT